MLVISKSIRISLNKITVSPYILLLVMGLLVMHGCATHQIIVPKVTPEATHLRLAGKFVWYDLFTTDIKSTSRFYEELFGWTFSDIVSEKKIVKTISRNGIPIANAIYLDSKNSKENESQWLSYVSVDDVDHTLMISNKNNGTIFKEAKDLPDRGRVAIVKDPEGALFAIVTTSEGDPPDRDFAQNHWMGSELWTTDLNASLAFYHLLLGYEQKMVGTDPDQKYCFLVRNGQARAGIVKIKWDHIKPNWLPYIAVKDVMDIVSKAEELGGKILLSPDKSIRKGSVAIIADPSGAVFAVQDI